MKKGLLLLSVLSWLSVSAQNNAIKFGLEVQTSYTTPGTVPFWLRSNQYGSVPLSGLSGSFLGKLRKDYDTTQTRLLDWGFSFEGRANGGKGSNLTIIEGNGKIKLWIFELKGGRIKEVMGLADTLLSSGNFAFSGTALGIPKVQIAVPEFYPIPVFGGIFAIKGHWAHGWIGSVPIQEKRVDEAVTYLHQKAMWARIGRANSRFKVYGGFNDNAFWGNERQIFETFVFSDWQSYRSVAFGKNWADSKVGNHAGTIDLRIEAEFKNFQLALYRQNFYEVGALYHLANIADGLNGVLITNKKIDKRKIKWNKILLEFLYTKNQAGETWSKPTPSGNENYLNHYMYQNGWSYKGIGLGTPFITPKNLARDGFPSKTTNYFINNRVIALHSGLIANVYNWSTMVKLSYSKNFGLHPTRETFIPAHQFSGYIDSSRDLSGKFYIGGLVAFDAGKLLETSGAMMIKVGRKF